MRLARLARLARAAAALALVVAGLPRPRPRPPLEVCTMLYFRFALPSAFHPSKLHDALIDIVAALQAFVSHWTCVLFPIH